MDNNHWDTWDRFDWLEHILNTPLDPNIRYRKWRDLEKKRLNAEKKKSFIRMVFKYILKGGI